MAHLQKSKNMDFGGKIVQKQYVFLFKGYCEVMLWRKKIGSQSCIVSPQRSAKNSHINKFPLANFARMRENLLVSGHLDVNAYCLIMKKLKNQTLFTYWLTLICTFMYWCIYDLWFMHWCREESSWFYFFPALTSQLSTNPILEEG